MLRAAESYVGDGWVEADKRFLALPELLRTGVGSDLTFTTPERMARDPYYQEFLRPHDLQWFAAVKIGDGDHGWLLSLQRSAAQGIYTGAELRRLARLSRNLSGAAEIARIFGLGRIDSALRTFEQSQRPAMLMGKQGEVLLANPSAERLLGQDLNIEKRRLVSFDRQATAALDSALHELIWTRRSDAMLPPVVLPRRAGRPLLAYPSRLAGLAGFGFPKNEGFLIFVDLAARPSAVTQDLIAAFGLTPAEARLAGRLATGDSVEDTAGQLGISYETARNLLKNVFHKTNTHRQGMLVALLNRMIAGAGAEGGGIG